MLNCEVGGGGVGEDGGEVGEAGDNITGGDNYKMRYLIKLTALIRETRACSSLLSHDGEIKGLFPNPLVPQ